MAESACLVHSFSYTEAVSHESHDEDNPLHALSQSISFGRYMTESLEWGKWSSFSHKKYVEEAEKFSRPGSVAQKKAFFEAHYKRIAEAKKAAAAAAAAAATDDLPQQVTGSDALPNASDIDHTAKQEVKEQTSESGSKINVDKDEEVAAERKSVQMEISSYHKIIVVDDKKAKDGFMVPDEMAEKEEFNLQKRKGSVGNENEVNSKDGDSSKKNRYAGEEDEVQKSATKDASGWKVSVEISASPKNPVTVAEIPIPEKISERMVAHKSRKKESVRRRFSLLNFLMGNPKNQDEKETRNKGRKQEKSSLCLCFKPRTL